MARSPSRSSDGAGPEHTRAEPRLLKAIEESNEEEVVAIIESAKTKSQPTEHLLRIGLARAAERGNISITEHLLKRGAKPDGAPGGRVSPLLRAIEKDHAAIVKLLLKYGGNVDVADKQGRTALMTAAWKNHFHILEELVRKGADVNRKDSKGRNVLHNLAADKHCNWGSYVIDLLLKEDVAIDGPQGQDDTQRTPLHWAASTGKKELCEMLLTRPRLPRANINAVEMKEKTPLHLAVAHGRDDIVELLIHYGADIKARSDGGWTPLHNACQQGSVKVVKMLLAAGAEINARVLNGSTPLHEAALAGHLEIVQCFLERKDCKRAPRDSFGITPFIRAAQKKHKEIINILAPFNHVDTLSEDALGACNGFNATIVDFGNFHNENRVSKRTMFELLYGRDPQNARKPAFNVLPKEVKGVNFRWVHLPANNMAWVEALLTKAFVEEGASDVAGFMALERSITHQHRGQQIHSHYMRPLCQSTPRAPKQHDDSDLSDSVEQGNPQIVINQGTTGLGIDTTAGAQESLPYIPKAPVRTGTISTDQTDWTVGSGSGREPKIHGKSKEKQKKTAKWGGGKQAGGRTGGTETPTKRPDYQARRHNSTPMTGSGHLRSPGSPARKDPTSVAKGNIFTFMPYLHFETNQKRREMHDAIDRVQRIKMRDRSDGRLAKPRLKKADTFDEMLLRAHLGSSTVSLHVRRTLDQFFYHNIDTQSRDEDQVVYRYQCRGRPPEELGIDPKIFMVDQLWMWILGKDLIVTAFPQRWQQPRNDPLNVLDGIIEDINSKTRDPVRSVYDLAMIITSRCSGVFDRHRMGDEDYQFLDMFESSIGDATEMETQLFQEFNTASAQASAWLQHHRRPNRFSRHLEAEVRHIEHENRRNIHSHSHGHTLANPPVKENRFHDDGMGIAHTPLFVDKLLDIGAETDLLAETKDIRDELNMIAKVLEDQRSVLPDLETGILDIYREEHKSQQELKRRFKEQMKTIDTHLKDLERMDKQAERIYKSITDLLDLKQKHANAFEARFARDQAAGTARQSQTIMVFTIVTIIFLPLSFIAAIFTINIKEFPWEQSLGNSEPSLPFSYVSKYMFGIGFAISIPLIAIAVSVDAIADFFREVKRRFAQRGNDHISPHKAELRDDKFDIEYAVDIPALEQALSAGRSTARGRRSWESFLGARNSLSLLPVSSRGTARSPNKRETLGAVHGNGNGAVRRGSSAARRPGPPIERMSTGFRMRTEDVEAGT
jgi:ankyrin repeat protein/Mg2+ and Co2+ transporter CorA